MAKYDQLSNLLKTRILNGDYAIKELPAERQLAADHGVAHMTARRALQQLVEDGLLLRGSNGRLGVNTSRSSGLPSLQLAMLTPSFNSRVHDRWRGAIVEVAAPRGAALRQVFYTHWDDPFIWDSLDNFDGVFLMPSSEPMPADTKKKLAQAKRPLVMLDNDMSAYGVPSVRLFRPGFVQTLLDHLAARGFGSIDCFNVQTSNEVIDQRIDQWRVWMGAHAWRGRLINEPVEPYADPLPHAYSLVRDLIAQGQLHCDALLCITTTAAVGAMRALHEAGIRPGRDIGVCAVDGEGVAAFHIPSLTALERCDSKSYIDTCLQWMAAGGGAWSGPLLMEPAEPLLAIRETTSSLESPIAAIPPAHFATNHKLGVQHEKVYF